MAFLIGVDEAGYGPNLGPLVITATVWEMSAAKAAVDLYPLLAPFVQPVPGGGDWIVGDSKVLYQPGQGLELLERNLLAALHLLHPQLGGWREVWQALTVAPSDELDSIPWHGDRNLALPRHACPQAVAALAELIRTRLRSAGVRLLGVHSVAVFPRRFNQLLENYGNKSTMLSQLTIGLLARVLAPLEGRAPVFVHADKHGGRNRYAPLLQQSFPEYLVEVYQEGAEESIYRWGPAGRRVEVRFSVRGERSLPAALASMTCKYLRELAMEVFNSFWRTHLPALKPTAGYPVDSRRFLQDIQGLKESLGIQDDLLWRSR